MRAQFSLENMDMSCFRNDAAYGRIKKRVPEQSGLKVSSPAISHKLSRNTVLFSVRTTISRNPKMPDSRNVRLKKKRAITEALKYFGMI